jgi:hypothetical protein
MEWNGICKTHEHHGYHQRNLPSPPPMPAQFHIYPSLCGPANPTNQLNQPTNQPINQQTNQDQPTTTNQPTNQPTNHTTPHHTTPTNHYFHIEHCNDSQQRSGSAEW